MSPPKEKMEKSEQAMSDATAVETTLQRLKERLAPVDEWVRETSKERPVLLLAGALGLGYLIARLLRRHG